MLKIKIFIVLFSCFYYVCDSHEGEKSKHNGFREPKTYFDILNEAIVNIQIDNEKDVATKGVEYLVAKINMIYQPLMRYSAYKHFGFNDDQTSNSGHNFNEDNSDELYNLFNNYFSFRDSLNSSSTCINDTGRLITGLVGLKPWAIQFFDASGKPGPALTKLQLNFVGDYDQCRASSAPSQNDGAKNVSGFDGNYCAVSLLTEVPFLTAMLGACLPSTCSSTDISSLVYDILDFAKLQPPVVGVVTQCLTAETEVTTATVFAILLLSIIGMLMFLGTLYDILAIKEVSGTESENESIRSSRGIRHNSSYESISSITSKDWNRSPTNGENSFFDRTRNQLMTIDSDEIGLLKKILLSFSVCSNGKKILSTKQSSGNLGAIHGIRFLSMCWVMLCHLYLSVIYFTMNGSRDISELLKRWTFLPVVNGFVSVDTFFTLSGLLMSYLTIQEMLRKKSYKINWFMFYFHRFWRLTPPYMLTLVLFLGLTQYMGKGPLWFNQQPYDRDFCEKNWWTNLLYVNNLVKYKEACLGHTWYLANDMQFFVLSPLLLIPFYFSRFAGIFSCIIFLLVSWITTGVLSTSHEWPTTTLTLKPVPGRASQPEWMEHYYVVPWCRIGPFIVGIMAGYILALRKGRPFEMHWLFVVIGWVTALASGLAIVYGIRGDIIGDNPSTLGAASFYNAVSRSVWGACVCWVIVACSAGYGGPVNKLLSWSPFVVLGRLTFMSYLIHPNLMTVFFDNLGALLYSNDTTVMTVYLGLLVFVNLVAFVCVLALESPWLSLEKAFFRKEIRSD